jgi:hypothetical protein
MKCKQCNAEYEAKRSTSLYCSPKCKQDFYRNRMTETVTLRAKSVTLKNAKPVTVTDLEKCQYCGTDLPKLQRPRRSVGDCYSCAIDQPSKPQPCASEGHTVSSTPIKDSCHSLTVMERLFYRPASQLKPGEHNFVSLPGRACYGVFE